MNTTSTWGTVGLGVVRPAEAPEGVRVGLCLDRTVDTTQRRLGCYQRQPAINNTHRPAPAMLWRQASATLVGIPPHELWPNGKKSSAWGHPRVRKGGAEERRDLLTGLASGVYADIGETDPYHPCHVGPQLAVDILHGVGLGAGFGVGCRGRGRHGRRRRMEGAPGHRLRHPVGWSTTARRTRDQVKTRTRKAPLRNGCVRTASVVQAVPLPR